MERTGEQVFTITNSLIDGSKLDMERDRGVLHLTISENDLPPISIAVEPDELIEALADLGFLTATILAALTDR